MAFVNLVKPAFENFVKTCPIPFRFGKDGFSQTPPVVLVAPNVFVTFSPVLLVYKPYVYNPHRR